LLRVFETRLTSVITLFGIALNLFVPEDAFEIVLNIVAIGIVAGWGMIILCKMRLRTWVAQGLAKTSTFKMPGAPVTSWVTLAFLASVLVLIALDYPNRTFTIGAFILIGIPALIIGWSACRARIYEIAAQRNGITGPLPVLAETAAMVAKIEDNEIEAAREADYQRMLDQEDDK
jgi:L-asparagine permease